MGRVLALDYGQKRIGLALSDQTRFLASPFGTIQNRGLKFVVEELEKIIGEKGVDLIVVGLPVTLKGTYSEKTVEVETWIEHLKKLVSVPVDTFDERLSTVQAQKVLHDQGRKVGDHRDKIDQFSAAIFLQAYLDRLKSRSE